MTGLRLRSRTSLGLLALVVVGALGGCGGAGRAVTVGSDTSKASTVSSTTATVSSTTDTVSASGDGGLNTVTIRSGGAPTRTVSSVVSMPPGSQVSSVGSATANLTFARVSACALLSTGSTPGQATSRNPPTALLELTAGTVACTVPSSPAQLQLCGTGVIYANGSEQQGDEFAATCDQDPLFSVAVLTGSVRVIDPGGHTTELSGGQMVRCDPAACTPQVVPATFTAAELAAFQTQSRQLGDGSSGEKVTTLAPDDAVRQAIVAAWSEVEKLAPADVSSVQVLNYSYDPGTGRDWALAVFQLTPAGFQKEPNSSNLEDQEWVLSESPTGPWEVANGCYEQVPKAVATAWQLVRSSSCE